MLLYLCIYYQRKQFIIIIIPRFYIYIYKGYNTIYI